MVQYLHFRILEIPLIMNMPFKIGFPAAKLPLNIMRWKCQRLPNIKTCFDHFWVDIGHHLEIFLHLQIGICSSPLLLQPIFLVSSVNITHGHIPLFMLFYHMTFNRIKSLDTEAKLHLPSLVGWSQKWSCDSKKSDIISLASIST